MKDYQGYLPRTGDDEAVFDQMVSIWVGRFTGKLKQRALASPNKPDLKLDMESIEISAGS